ncbi:PilZ domain-containing protein [Motiliproteus sp. MSK22-1]|uniref:PilZ domain-containing protein n=1 Tax=Motiliproteus sp. MSK22-1 TaxID=1897630 RepID=UPI000978719A|nr:PilZ domain-containing protein [Motiliproteus sp. MSK22-1]OMH25262.1 hypothetical protein BGP75_26035 [Motiliproteus sp. MSK22-1]
MSDWNIDNDRRRTFRIEEKASVSFRVLDSNRYQSPEKLFPASPEFTLLNDLRSIDEDSESLLRQVSETDKAAAAYLRLLNRKIERLAQALTSPHTEDSKIAITLSEEGMSLSTQNPVEPGQLMAVKLQLLPEGVGIIAMLKVIYCLATTEYFNEDEQNSFRLGGEFVDMKQHDRSLIARHLIESQAKERRLLKEQLIKGQQGKQS